MYSGHQTIICEGKERVMVDLDKSRVTIRIWPTDAIDTGGVSLVMEYEQVAKLRRMLNNLVLNEETR